MTMSYGPSPFEDHPHDDLTNEEKLDVFDKLYEPYEWITNTSVYRYSMESAQ